MAEAEVDEVDALRQRGCWCFVRGGVEVPLCDRHRPQSADWWSIERPSTMWVRLRSSRPGSSSVSAHGISSSSPRIASIDHEVPRPPLIAKEKEPWSATAAAPNAAIFSAASRAAAFVGDDLEVQRH